MTDYVITAANSVTTTGSENIPAQTLGLGDTLVVTADGSLKTQGTSQPAVLAASGSVAITVDGLVEGEQLHAINIAAGGNTITVGATGQVLANPGEDGGYGIRLRGFNGGGDSTVTNDGLISGLVGISFSMKMTNGTPVGGNLTVVNNGIIVGFPSDDAAAIAAETGNSSITNNGQLLGNVFLGAGDDVYDGTNGTITGKILLNGGDDTAIGGAGDETFLGGAGDDTLLGGGGNDTALYLGLDGAGGIVNITVDLSQAGAQNTGEGLDTLNGIENVTGGAGDDTLTGDGQANQLDGGDGNDVLSGGLGDDVLIGGAGIDTAVYLGLDGSGNVVSVTVDLNQAGAQNTGEGLDALNGIENFTGGAGDDTLMGDEQNNELDGGGGNDTLTGGLGNDVLTGGDGSDTAVYLGLDGSGNVVSVTVDLSQAGAQDTGEGLDTLIGIENVTGGAGADALTGNGQDNELGGGDGNDVLTGGRGNDMLIGGAGSDRAVYLGLDGIGGTVSITVDLNQAGAQDTGEGVDTLSGIENVTGGAGDDTLVGDGQDNELDGGDGNDTLTGGLGNDVLTGGAGSDTAVYLGLDGAGGIVNVTVDLNQAGAQNTGEGFDTLSGVENVTGGAGDDSLTGDGQDNRLDGGDGDDTLAGGLGNDVLTGRAGSDTAVYLGLDGAGGIVNVAVDLNQTGAQNTGEGADTLIGIENVTSGDGNDFLIGNAEANVLSGGGGPDELVGNDGMDNLAGGDGNDKLYGGVGNDTLGGGEGDDVLVAGGGADTLIGGDGKDEAYIAGDGTNVTLSGIEILVGSGGGDTIAVDDATFNGLESLDGGNGSDEIRLGGGVFDFTQTGLTILGIEGFTLTAANTVVVVDTADEAMLIDASAVSGAEIQVKGETLTDAQRTALYGKGFAKVTYGASFTQEPDAPTVAPVTVDEDGIASVVIVRAPSDGSEVTHYQITGITNGTLYRDAARTQVITDGAFIEADGLTTTLYFKPDADFAGDASFAVRASLGTTAADLGAGVAQAAITVTQVPDAPTGLSLTGSVAAELAATGTLVGTLSASDADPGTTLTYTLVDNAGGRFALSGDKLVVANGVGLDFEQSGTHTVKVRVDDGTGRFMERNFTVTVSDIGTENTAGTGGNDTVFGGAGRDNLAGGAGNDHLAGGANRDTLNGGAGRDRLDGDLGIDRLTGGADRDIFMFDTKLGSSNVDVVVDFNVRDDSFQLDNAVFRKLGAGSLTKPGKLSKDAFHIGKTAEDREDRILYDRSTGALSYDADGTGSAKAVKFATLKKGLALTYHDFFVI